jgi:anti-sigma-K factor RskA
MSNDLHSLAPLYALDALDGTDGLERFERHLAECSLCRAEVQGFAETAALLGASEATAPPAGLRASVLAAAAEVRQERPTAAVIALPRRSRRWPALAAAAAVVTVVGAGSLVSRNRTTDSDRVAAVLAAPDRREVPLAGDGSARISLVHSPTRNRSVLVVNGMAAPEPGKTYELWLIDDTAKRPDVVFEPDENGDAVVLVEGDAATAKIAAITVEPDGGRPVPSGGPIYAGEI